MRFDPDNPGKLVFDKRKNLSSSELDDLKFQSGTIVDDVIGDIVPFTRDSHGNRVKSGNGISVLILIPSILAILAGVVLRNVLVILIGFASAVFISGIYVVITGGVKSVKNAEVYSDDTANRLIGVGMILCSIVPFVVWYGFLVHTELLKRVLLTAGSVIACLGVLILISFVFLATAKARIYKQEVKATCIGYARFIDYIPEGAGKAHPVPFVSPVFEYTYNGKKITAVYDGFCKGTDSDIDLGETSIHISPTRPDGVYNRKAGRKITAIVMGILMLTIAVALFVVVMKML